MNVLHKVKLGIHVHHAFPYISLPTTSRNCLISRFVEKENIIITANIKYLIHVTREFYFAKVICRNLYALFSNVRRAYTVNKNGVQLFITGGRITNQRKRKCLWAIKAVNRLHSHGFPLQQRLQLVLRKLARRRKTKTDLGRFLVD